MFLPIQAYYPPSQLRFLGVGGVPPSLEQLRRGSRAGALCLSGQAPLTDRQGRTVLALLIPTVPSDAETVRRWYDDEDTHYGDRKWYDWWLDKIRHGERGAQVNKLVAPSGEILGLVMTEKIYDRKDNTPSLLVRGLRISPYCNTDITEPAHYRGTGTAIITLLVAEALKNGLKGIGVNSSVGVEGFYEHVMGPAKGKAHDGVRSYFSLKGDEALAFLQKQFAVYQNKLG